jgi:hypothetical protein
MVRGTRSARDVEIRHGRRNQELTLNAQARLVLMLLTLCGVPARAQQPPAQPEQVETDNDPTRPVFVSFRPEFYKISDDVDRFALISRYDAAVFRRRGIPGAKTGIILRFELPLAHTDTAAASALGLGDAYAQFLLVPHATRTFAWVAGSGFTLPTATDPLLGSGKWVAAPLGLPLWRFSRGLFLIKVQNFMSFAGDDDRPDIHYLLVTPVFLHAVGRNWWVLADTETKSNWKADGRTGVKSGFQVGRRTTRRLGVWVKPEVWWGANRDGKWNLKFGFVWYQRR